MIVGWRPGSPVRRTLLPLRKAFVSVFRIVIARLPDRLALSILYLRHFRRFPDLDHPVRFSEKVQARKLAARDPIFPGLVDKIEVKRFVRNVLGDDWVIPTLWTCTTLRKSDAHEWPIPFVVKANNGSGTNLFVRAPAELDWGSLEATVAAWMRKPYTPYFREWPYALIEPRVLVEPFIGDGTKLPLDYKMFVFKGRVEFIQVDFDRECDHKRSFYNRDWIKQEFAYAKPVSSENLAPPASLLRMISAAEKLSAGLDFCRIDFYEVDGKPLFGEITLFPESGLASFSPSSWDEHFGSLWPLKRSA
jgi:TupA-like ATPgrasp